MTSQTPAQSVHVGFLSVFQEGSGYVGGYLVTNGWGRPLEFRLTSAVQPTRVQQILYGTSLPAYVSGELIGKTLLDKTSTPVQLIVTDSILSLELRRHVEVPVALVCTTGEPGVAIAPNLYGHAQFPDDVATVRKSLDRLGAFDLSEPFVRIREAIGEARKMGVGPRSAAA